MTKKYLIKTFGCAMNHSDSERIAAVLEKHNFQKTSDINVADLVIFNTCGVRQMAEDRVYGQIHNMKKRAICNRQHVTIILTGCLANRKDVQRRLKDKVDLFCEIRNFSKEFEKLNHKSQTTNRKRTPSAKHQIRHTSKEDIAYLSIKPKHAKNFEVFVPIMTGCNNFCAYCVVPYARGHEISRSSKEIIQEIKSSVKKRCKHIILLGQNVNSYNDGKNNFSMLLRKINSIPGKFWVSFMSNHPKDVTDEMIETVAKCQKVCECFHLPVQSGNDEVIKKMNRKYTAKKYSKIVDKIKKAYKKHKPGIPHAITSDIIVGFPGETKKQFMDSAKIMKKVKYDMVFFGQYSPRPGTAAWKMTDNVSKAEKVRRENYLNEILKKTALENNKKYTGRVLEVLIEKKQTTPRAKLLEFKSLALGKITYFGKTRTMKNVKITINNDCHPGLDQGSKNLVGKIIQVKIIKANTWNLEGVCCLTYGRKKGDGIAISL